MVRYDIFVSKVSAPRHGAVSGGASGGILFRNTVLSARGGGGVWGVCVCVCVCVCVVVVVVWWVGLCVCEVAVCVRVV